jgi:hypothetical protein
MVFNKMGLIRIVRVVCMSDNSRNMEKMVKVLRVEAGLIGSGMDLQMVCHGILFYFQISYKDYIPQPPPLLEPVPIGRVATGSEYGIKFLPQLSSFEYRWII